MRNILKPARCGGGAPGALVASAATPMVSTPMSTPSVAHLHVHSEYSLLDGACKIDKLAERAASFGQPALGLTDHGVMNGAVELYKATRKHGIKPIVGLEAYFVDDRHSREPKVERNHLTLLAENDEGLRNLVKLSSAGWPNSAARAASLSILQAPSSSEYSLWACRCTAAGLLTGGTEHAK